MPDTTQHADYGRRLPLRGEQVRCNVDEPHKPHLQALPCRNGTKGELYPIVCPGVPWNDALDVVIGMAEAAAKRLKVQHVAIGEGVDAS